MLFTTGGKWVDLDVSPVPAGAEGSDFDQDLRRAGYREWESFPEQGNTTTLRLEVSRQVQPSRTKPLFCICVNVVAAYEVVYAESVPALMQLLSQWLPAVQGAAVTQLLGSLEAAADKKEFAHLLTAALEH
ncbi:hypothetical protein [Streptomyces sp. NPDC057579]|uniref:hypothetical protein n=1 Tax=Streptomyces sp. NPDC057579 TaxID=3346172 RepID=UPI00369DEE09